MQVVLDVATVICGLVMLLAAKAVLGASARAEVSLRSAAALCVGLAGIQYISQALQPGALQLHELALPFGVTLWIAHAAWVHRGAPMRRATDWGELADHTPAEGNRT